jgi:hypothetical protein
VTNRGLKNLCLACAAVAALGVGCNITHFVGDGSSLWPGRRLWDGLNGGCLVVNAYWLVVFTRRCLEVRRWPDDPGDAEELPSLTLTISYGPPPLIRDMKEGEEGFVVPWAVHYVEAGEGRHEIRGDYYVRPAAFGTARLPIRRTARGVEVLRGLRQSELCVSREGYREAWSPLPVTFAAADVVH